jgi:hypothetical protein
MIFIMSVPSLHSPSKTGIELCVSSVLPGVARGTAIEELPGVMTSEESPGASAIFKGSDI